MGKIVMEYLDTALEYIDQGYSILLHGPGGTGKTHALRTIASALTQQGRAIGCTATTGIAAINLSIPEDLIVGWTVHSWSGIRLGKDPADKLVATVNKDRYAKARWLNSKVLMIDEISMMGADLFNKLDYVGRQIRRVYDLPFGGLQLILSGDFMQLSPVNEKWVFTSSTWKELIFKPIIFEEPKRYNDVAWYERLLRFRKGNHTVNDTNFLRDKNKEYIKWKAGVTKDELVVKPTILHSKRIDVDVENTRELEILKGDMVEFIADDSVVAKNSYAKHDHYIKPLDDAIPKVVCLKQGAQVMLKANLDIEANLANGTRGVVMECNSEGANVKWRDGTITLVTRHTWIHEDKDGKATREQIPLILAWSLTIHRVQGCTLDYVVCNIGPSIFLPGQAYVALSRVRSSDGLLVSDLYLPVIKVDKESLEFVESLETPPEEALDDTPSEVEEKMEPEVEIEIRYEFVFED